MEQEQQLRELQAEAASLFDCQDYHAALLKANKGIALSKKLSIQDAAVLGRLYLLRGNAYLMTSNCEWAVSEYNTVLELDGTHAEVSRVSFASSSILSKLPFW